MSDDFRTDYHCVIDPSELEALADECRHAEAVSFDLETSSLDWRTGEIAGWALSIRPHQGWYVPVAHFNEFNLDREYVASVLGPMLQQVPLLAIFNAKFDSAWTREIGYPLDPTKIFDTMLGRFVEGTPFFDYDLKAMTENIFGHKMVHFKDLFPPHTKVFDIRTLPSYSTYAYACEDADWSLQHLLKCQPVVGGSFIYQVESDLWPVVQAIEDVGVEVDRQFLTKASRYLLEEAELVWATIQAQAAQMIGHPIEFRDTTDSLRELLFETLHLPSYVTTPGGKASTSEEALTALAYDYPICHNILVYRSMRSTATSEGTTLPGHIHPLTGAIHTQFNQHGARTGRFSSSGPNLQNQGKLKKWQVYELAGSTREVRLYPRDAFVARPGYYLIELDFKAIEYVLVAAIAHEESVVRAYNDGDDLHVQTASDMLKVPRADVTEPQRDIGKTLNYSCIYGIGSESFGTRTHQSKEDAEEALNLFFKARPAIKSLIDHIRDVARATHEVYTLMKRKIPIPELNDRSNRRAYSKGLRLSVNASIQGLAADIQKIGLLRTHYRALAKWSRELARCILHTHDSQTWEVRQSIAPQEIVPLLIEAMSPPLEDYGLPRIQVDAKVGVSWARLTKYDQNQDYSELWATWASEREQDLANSFGKTVLDIGDDFEPMEPTAPATNGHEELHMVITVDVTPLADQDAFACVNDLLSVLRSFPGPNVIELHAPGQEPTKLTKSATSLREGDLKSILTKYPSTVISTQKTQIVAAVAAGIFG